MTIRFSEDLIARLERAGLNESRLKALELSDDKRLQEVVDRLPRLQPVFDAGKLLGIGPPAAELPSGKPWALTVIVPVPTSFNSLRESEIGKELIACKETKDLKWANAPIGPGEFQVTFPIGYGNPWHGESQSVVLTAIGLLCLEKAGFRDPLSGQWALCLETNHNGRRYELCWMHRQLCLSST